MNHETPAALCNGTEDSSSVDSVNYSDQTPHNQPFIIGVAGGTASGKTTVCNMIITQLRDHRVILISQDSFYHSLTDEQLEKVQEHNFDHPDAFDTELLLLSIEKLQSGQAVTIHNYDFKSHTYVEPARKVNPSDVIILEGILLLHDSRVREFMNMKIFVDTDSDVRLARRIQRDTVKRARNIENVLDQVVEIGLGHLPFTEKQVTTPTGSIYAGVVFCKRLCGVSIIRSGESMENALRACCKGIKIGKILIHGDGNNGRQLIYEKLPADISSRQVLLLNPVLASGNSAIKAISVLLSKGVSECNIIFLNLIAAPEGLNAVCKKFPKLKIVTSEIDSSLNQDLHVIPGMGEFADRYFGTN